MHPRNIFLEFVYSTILFIYLLFNAKFLCIDAENICVECELMLRGNILRRFGSLGFSILEIMKKTGRS
jgi:hypothetical protein